MDLRRGVEKETRAKQTVAARVTTKPGVAGLKTIMQLNKRLDCDFGRQEVNNGCGGVEDAASPRI